MPTKIIVDCSTGETTEVELTAEEIADLETARNAAEDQRKAEEKAAAAKEAKRKEILERLGLTAEEAAILLG
jgi:hypothetical protein